MFESCYNDFMAPAWLPHTVPSRRVVAWAIALLALLVLVLPTPSSQATLTKAVPLRVLAQRAVAVVVAVPVSHHSHWSPQHRIITEHQLRVRSAIAGNVPKTITVLTLGGRVGNVAQRVFGEASLPIGKPALVFLTEARPSLAVYRVLAMSQGAYPIQSQTSGKQLLLRPPTLPAFVRRPEARSAVVRLPGMSLDQAKHEILLLRGERRDNHR